MVGTGAAGLNAAIHLAEFEVPDILVVTEGLKMGTSRNTGSDKQTYYKTNFYGADADSPVDHARTLFEGGCTHGDVALVEATNSIREFLHLVQLGVPFPHDEYGGFVGYKTDHDPRQRATSAGPLTSQYMVECLLARVWELNIPLLDKTYIAKLFTAPSEDGKSRKKQVLGALGFSTHLMSEENPDNPWGLVLFNARHIILATGGPASIYETSVYPVSQYGSTGLALQEGAIAQNLTDSQFGLASIKFRWNLSGSYQQVIPTYISTNMDGDDAHEFLHEVFPDPTQQAEAIFLKGYQWPFDVRKTPNLGSSLIDMLVTRERKVKERRVWLDFRQNFRGFQIDRLGEIPKRYLEASGALIADSPLERLKHLNPDAIILYSNHGINLESEPLEIAVCAQHCNGGLKGDIWWESNIQNLFPVGEINGSHGIYRPGGAALNAGQVGGLRAAQRIKHHQGSHSRSSSKFLHVISADLQKIVGLIQGWLKPARTGPMTSIREYWDAIRGRSDQYLMHIRPVVQLPSVLASATASLSDFPTRLTVPSPSRLPDAFRVLDALITQVAMLSALIAYAEKRGVSRGSALLQEPVGTAIHEKFPPEWRFRVDGSTWDGEVGEVYLDENGTFTSRFVPVTPLPKQVAWFETVWKEFRTQ